MDIVAGGDGLVTVGGTTVWSFTRLTLEVSAYSGAIRRAVEMVFQGVVACSITALG